LGAYRGVFRVPGTLAFCTAGFVMRWSIAIYPIGLVLIVSARTGEYGFAGVLSACYVLGSVPGTPILARLVDRFGQGRLLLPASGVHAAAVVLLAVLLQADAPDWTLLAPAVLAGFAYLSVGSLIRARWSFALAGTPELSTAYSLESTLDELIFVTGPLIASVIATQVEPLLVLYVGLALVLSGAFWLWRQPRTTPPPHPVGQARLASALRSRGMLLLTVMAVAMGAIFASAEVTMVAFCGQHGQRSATGVVIACFALGSAVAGFFYGARPWRTDILTRFRWHAAVLGVLPLVFIASVNVPMLAGCAFIVGLGVAPTLITCFGVIDTTVPAAALTEGFAWLVTGLSLGYGAGSALVGGIADAHGARVAFTVTIASGLTMGLLAQVLYHRLHESRQASQPVAVG
jgi:MFS family permease